MRKYSIPILLIALFLLLGGCAIGPKQTFLATQQTFNEMVKAYHAYYEACSPEEQAELREDVHPKVIEALSILEGMNEAFRLGLEPSQIDKEKFRELRYKLYQRLPEIFGGGQ
jgi:hypothetical protein